MKEKYLGVSIIISDEATEAVGDKNDVEFHVTEFDFTDKELNKIRTILKGFDKDDVEHFIEVTRVYCERALKIDRQEDIKDSRNRIESKITKFIQLRDHIEDIASDELSPGIDIGYYKTVAGYDRHLGRNYHEIPDGKTRDMHKLVNRSLYYSSNSDKCLSTADKSLRQTEIIEILKDKAEKIIDDLQDIMFNLKELKDERSKGRGRPSADQYELILNIARAYHYYFGKMPSSYSDGNLEDGHFFEIVKALNEAIRFPGLENPRRQIIQARKALAEYLTQKGVQF